jgi:alkylated DNA repair dioxygenase AlkB
MAVTCYVPYIMMKIRWPKRVLSVVSVVKGFFCLLLYVWKYQVETIAVTDALSPRHLDASSCPPFQTSFPCGTVKSSSLLVRLSASSSSKPTTTIKTKADSSKSLQLLLQQSISTQDILQNVACQIKPDQDPDGSLSCLILVRLSKQMIADDNQRQPSYNTTETSITRTTLQLLKTGLRNTIHSLVQASWTDTPSSLEFATEGIKAVAVIARILARPQQQQQQQDNIPLPELITPLFEKFRLEAKDMIPMLHQHHLSGLQWAMDNIQCAIATQGKKYFTVPPILQDTYDALELPFRIRPGFLLNSPSISFANSSVDDVVTQFVQQVDFQSDVIQTTTTNRTVQERRQTSWQGDETVTAFSYSSKSMTRQPWSPLVKTIRQSLYETTYQYYDGCLLNLYPDGESGMRYHSDPDQGTLWGYNTAVVSIGATRKIAFRSINNGMQLGHKPHVFVLFHGDVTEMFHDCQARYQHTIKTAEAKQETSPRISLVFKKTLKSL